jgi:hypothetical protein
VRTVIFKTSGGCAPIPGIGRWFRRCGHFVEEGLRLALEPQVETVVMAASWAGFVKRAAIGPQDEGVWADFEEALRKLVQSGKRVVLVLSTPRGEAFDPKSFIRRAAFGVEPGEPLLSVARSKATEATAPVDARLRAIALAVGAATIEPVDWLCTASHCPRADELGRPIFRDASHLRASVARERFVAVDRYVYLR